MKPCIKYNGVNPSRLGWSRADFLRMCRPVCNCCFPSTFLFSPQKKLDRVCSTARCLRVWLFLSKYSNNINHNITRINYFGVPIICHSLYQSKGHHCHLTLNVNGWSNQRNPSSRDSDWLREGHMNWAGPIRCHPWDCCRIQKPPSLCSGYFICLEDHLCFIHLVNSCSFFKMWLSFVPLWLVSDPSTHCSSLPFWPLLFLKPVSTMAPSTWCYLHLYCTLKQDLLEGGAHGLFTFWLPVLIPVPSTPLVNALMNEVIRLSWIQFPMTFISNK